VKRVAIGFGIDGDGFDAHAPRSFDDAAGDFAAIGDQNSLEHAAMDPASPAFSLCCGAAQMSTAAHAAKFGFTSRLASMRRPHSPTLPTNLAAARPIALQNYMKLRGRRRVRTWLAIHART
jgi:hypothetical protein